MKTNSRQWNLIAVWTLVFAGQLLFAQQGGGGNQGEGPGDSKNPKKSGYLVVVEPDSVLLQIDDQQQFTAYLEDSTGARRDTTFTWSIAGKEIGTVTETGLFTALEKGTSHVIASAGRLSGKALVQVDGDPAQINVQKKGLKIDVRPSSVVLAVGDTLTFSAVCTDSNGAVIDTTFEWSVDGDFAAITEVGFLEVYSEGDGFVYATVGDLSGKAHIIVRTKPDDPGKGPAQSGKRNLLTLVIDPAEASLMVGELLQFEAFLEDTLGNRQDADVSWKLIGKKIGTLSETGLFTADTSGLCMVQAKMAKYSAVARVMVLTEEDVQNKDPVQIRLHDRDGNQVGNIKRLAETDILKISGLPFPLNVLNGGELVLPPGSLNEGITIEITLPDLAEIRGDTSVTFTDAVLMGFSFDVYVNGEKVSPYVFETPVQVVLPYKPELMEDLGIALEDLAVLFYKEDGSYEDAGIFNVVVDTSENKVYAEVSHFSQVILGSGPRLNPTGVGSEMSQQPTHSRLLANYPNPFNPETVIPFDVAGRLKQRIRITIYNLIGQNMRLLVDRAHDPGHYTVHWDGLDSFGKPAASGMYLVRFEAGDVTMTRRMLLIR